MIESLGHTASFMFMLRTHLIFIFLVGLGLVLIGVHESHAQNAIGSGPALKLYQQHCAVCHGPNFNEGLGGSLLEEWDYVTPELSVDSIIKNGLEGLDMNGFDAVLSDEEIRSVAILIEEERLRARNAKLQIPDGEHPVFETRHHRFSLENVVEPPTSIFWGMDFLPDGRILLTVFDGQLHIFENGKLSPPVEGTPNVWRRGQGGLMDVGVHPDYEENGWIYLSFSEKLRSEGGTDMGITSVVRGKIIDNRWTDQELLFRADPRFANSAGVHFGSRFVFQDGYLFFGIGDRGRQNEAQDVTRPNGSIHRIHDDGRIPDDNPFRDQADAFPTLWTIGNRNPQGLAIHPTTGAIWETEHGPRGGDEVNVIKRGVNYGWPVITYGMNYNGTPITSETRREGMAQPVVNFTPSIAICGMDFYTGDPFPEWNHHLFLGGLASQEVWRLKTEGDAVVEKELILKDRGRVRDVGCGPDGTLYLILNKGKRSGPGGLYKLVPED
jgi:glucose/arabinose dehydrogenase